MDEKDALIQVLIAQRDAALNAYAQAQAKLIVAQQKLAHLSPPETPEVGPM